MSEVIKFPLTQHQVSRLLSLAVSRQESIAEALQDDDCPWRDELEAAMEFWHDMEQRLEAALNGDGND